jgi:hypothetical protein
VLLAGWLAVAPLIAAGVVLPLNGQRPGLLVDLGLVPAGQPLLPAWAAGLIATLLALALHGLVLVPVLLASRAPGRELVRTVAALGLAIARYLALAAAARLPFPDDPTLTAALQLALTLPFLLGGLAMIEARRDGISLPAAWRAMGLRAYTGSALWLALAASAAAVWP